MNFMVCFYFIVLGFDFCLLIHNAICQFIAYKKSKQEGYSYLMSSVFAYERFNKFLLYFGYLLGLIMCLPFVAFTMGLIK